MRCKFCGKFVKEDKRIKKPVNYYCSEKCSKKSYQRQSKEVSGHGK